MKLMLTVILTVAIVSLVNCRKIKVDEESKSSSNGSSSSESKETTKWEKKSQKCLKKIDKTLKKIDKLTSENESLNEAIVSAFQAAQLDEYLIDDWGVIRVNVSSIVDNFFVAVPQIAPVVAQLGLPDGVLKKLNKIVEVIEQLKINQRVINHLVGKLLLADLEEYVSGQTGAQKVDFDRLQQDPEGRLALACFVTRGKNNDKAKQIDDE